MKTLKNRNIQNLIVISKRNIFNICNANFNKSIVTNKSFAINKYFVKNFSFEQTKEKQKRHFMLIYKFVDDMHYKRSKSKFFLHFKKFPIEKNT